MDYDFVNPSHYKDNGKEVWEMMLELWGKDKFIAHCEMCAFKYRMRLGKKPNEPIDRDLSKAKWYEDKANELLSGKHTIDGSNFYKTEEECSGKIPEEHIETWVNYNNLLNCGNLDSVQVRLLEAYKKELKEAGIL